MPAPDPQRLTRRERQIMDILYERGHASAAEVLDHLPDPPSYSAVRALLAKLERKGQILHRQDGPRYLYQPVVPRQAARRNAAQRLVRTFFDGSVTHAVSGLLDASRPTDRELDELAGLIERARKGASREDRSS